MCVWIGISVCVCVCVWGLCSVIEALVLKDVCLTFEIGPNMLDIKTSSVLSSLCFFLLFLFFIFYYSVFLLKENFLELQSHESGKSSRPHTGMVAPCFTLYY